MFIEEKQKLGRISVGELKLIVLYFILTVLWMTGNVHGMTIAMSAVLITTVLFMPGINLLEWKEASKSIDWGIPILFSAGYALADALDAGGVVTWITDIATGSLVNMTAITLAVSMMITFMIIRIGFTNYTAMVASLFPVALTFAEGSSFNPLWLGMICLMASNIAYFLPTQSGANMITYTLGIYSAKDFVVTGTFLSVISLVVTLLAAFLYWPLVGLAIYP